MMMDAIRDDLAALNIHFDVFFSERSLIEGKRDEVGATIESLRKSGEVYEGRLPPPKGGNLEDWEDREQTLFRSTDFGDDVDRPLKKSDGSYTYFASDIAYHRSKVARGFLNLIDVWGADHGGYIKRMQAAVKAVSGGKAELDVKLVQLVRLLRAGEPVKMSKRAGEFVTLREVVDEVGRDAVRFDMLYRKNDAVLDFDLAKVIEHSRENPVFYVQYGHARGQSVFRNAREEMPELPETADGAGGVPQDRRRSIGSATPAKSPCCDGLRFIHASSKPRPPPTNPTGLHSICMNWQVNFMRCGRAEKTCLIYASLSRMIEKRRRPGLPWWRG